MSRSSRGWLRAFQDWLAQPQPSPSSPDSSAPDALPSRIGHYAITRKLGEGGMGIVYEARDERLERSVALKMLPARTYSDETARKRFWREARAAARVNHPNVCQIHEIGEDGGELFIAMELLQGEPLDAILRKGPLDATRVVSIGSDVLAALAALHAAGIVHRDLKPSNVFLTTHGVKLLDFGLARPGIEETAEEASRLTRPGMIVGTPHYMAPEGVVGDPIDARSDLFAVGAMLFEMLAGRPAFGGRSVIEILHAAVHEQPPALTGPPAVKAIDRVIRWALAKRPADRPASADEMAGALRAVPADEQEAPAIAQTLTRIVVLPFRVLRADPDSDFLAFSLPDAIAASLSGIGSIVVRSSAVASRFAVEATDLKAIAADADVDRVVMGTLLRAGSEIRVSAQLVEAPAGTLLASLSVQSSLDDLFRLQDDIARRVVETVAPTLTGLPTPASPPGDAQAYALYLRANELARSYDRIVDARDLYLRCLERDPGFAPAWAQLGRCHRVIGKYVGGAPGSGAEAEAALRRALDLDPRLTIAHKYCASIEAETGHTPRALERLLGEAHRRGNDPELFAGLVHACRYGGLYDESLAAHAEARRLDPNVPTSILETLLLAGDVERLLAADERSQALGPNQVMALGLAGRHDEARRRLAETHGASRHPAFRAWLVYLEAWLDRRTAGMAFDSKAFGLDIDDDPEAIFQEGWLLCEAGEFARGLASVQRAVARGYWAAPVLAHSPHFDPLRADPVFRMVLATAEAGRREAAAAFQAGGGQRILGTPAAA